MSYQKEVPSRGEILNHVIKHSFADIDVCLTTEACELAHELFTAFQTYCNENELTLPSVYVDSAGVTSHQAKNKWAQYFVMQEIDESFVDPRVFFRVDDRPIRKTRKSDLGLIRLSAYKPHNGPKWLEYPEFKCGEITLKFNTGGRMNYFLP